MKKFIIIHAYVGYENKNYTQIKYEIIAMLRVNLEVLLMVNAT